MISYVMDKDAPPRLRHIGQTKVTWQMSPLRNKIHWSTTPKDAYLRIGNRKNKFVPKEPIKMSKASGSSAKSRSLLAWYRGGWKLEAKWLIGLDGGFGPIGERLWQLSKNNVEYWKWLEMGCGSRDPTFLLSENSGNKAKTLLVESRPLTRKRTSSKMAQDRTRTLSNGASIERSRV